MGLLSLIDATTLARKNNNVARILNNMLNHCDIKREVYIPPTTTFSHGGHGVVIGGGVKIGDNVTIYQGTTIGTKISKGYPTIGNDVTIFPLCVIVGDIKIGDNSIIGACTYVDQDIPPNSVVYNKKELVIKNKRGG